MAITLNKTRKEARKSKLYLLLAELLIYTAKLDSRLIKLMCGNLGKT